MGLCSVRRALSPTCGTLPKPSDGTLLSDQVPLRHPNLPSQGIFICRMLHFCRFCNLDKSPLRSGFECSSNEIVPLYLVCNGVKDCSNAHDEMYCSNRTMCYETWQPDPSTTPLYHSYTTPCPLYHSYTTPCPLYHSYTTPFYTTIIPHVFPYTTVKPHPVPYTPVIPQPVPYTTVIPHPFIPQLYHTFSLILQSNHTLSLIPQLYPTLSLIPQLYHTLSLIPQLYHTLSLIPQLYHTFSLIPQLYHTLSLVVITTLTSCINITNIF